MSSQRYTRARLSLVKTQREVATGLQKLEGDIEVFRRECEWVLSGLLKKFGYSGSFQYACDAFSNGSHTLTWNIDEQRFYVYPIMGSQKDFLRAIVQAGPIFCKKQGVVLCCFDKDDEPFMCFPPRRKKKCTTTKTTQKKALPTP